MIPTFVYLSIMGLIIILCSAPRNTSIPILRRMREQHETNAEDEEEDEEDSALDDDADDERQYFYFNSVHISTYLILCLNSLQRRGILFERHLIGGVGDQCRVRGRGFLQEAHSVRRACDWYRRLGEGH